MTVCYFQHVQLKEIDIRLLVSINITRVRFIHTSTNVIIILFIYPLQVSFSASTKTQMAHKKGRTATEKN